VRTPLHSADYYEERARTFRAMLDDMESAAARESLLNVVREYELLAQKARNAPNES
jgi:hypothetical protein